MIRHARQLERELAASQARGAELLKDKARLDWFDGRLLEIQSWTVDAGLNFNIHDKYCGYLAEGIGIRAAIDAAMGATNETDVRSSAPSRKSPYWKARENE
jgi:hypothetical protein